MYGDFGYERITLVVQELCRDSMKGDKPGRKALAVSFTANLMNTDSNEYK